MAITRRHLLAQLIRGVAAAASVSQLAASKGYAAPRSSGEPHISSPIRLDLNENAYGASLQAMAAICESAKGVSQYPASTAGLCETIARRHGVHPDQIVLGCGSSEVLRMAATAFLGPGRKMVLASPTFDLIAGYGKVLKAKVVEVPLRRNYSHDLEGMLAHALGATGLVYVCNPNNPTGTLTERREIEAFLRQLPATVYAVIDEAYHHYVANSGAYASFLDRKVDNPRVIVIRTFSMAYGLAGSRVGYAVASVEAAKEMAADRLQFGMNRAGLMAAMAALDERHHLDECARSNANDRQEFFNQVNARMLRALDSHTNFVCLNVMRPAAEIREHYRKNNFLLAPPIPAMPTYLRISLGRPEEMREFWRVWDLLGPHPMRM
jgi:histidinol-phosphate aminotransferase